MILFTFLLLSEPMVYYTWLIKFTSSRVKRQHFCGDPCIKKHPVYAFGDIFEAYAAIGIGSSYWRT